MATPQALLILLLVMRYFAVRNFARWQHYKDRKPVWIKLYLDLLGDYDFAQLPDAAKWHLCGIWLLASRYDNRLPWDVQWIKQQIGAKSDVDLDLLLKAGHIELCNPASKPLAKPEQVASPETETETETETEGPSAAHSRSIGVDGHGPEPSKPEKRKAPEEVLYEVYPRHVGRTKALKAIRYALKRIAQRGELDPFKFLAERTQQYADARAETCAANPAETQFTPHPTTWFNQGRYDDDPKEWRTKYAEPRSNDGRRTYAPSRKPTAAERGEFPEPVRPLPRLAGGGRAHPAGRDPAHPQGAGGGGPAGGGHAHQPQHAPGAALRPSA